MTIQDVILFDFQVEAVERMVERKKLLLALHMGLGKTLTSIAAIEEMLDGGRLQRGFIIVPASLKYQWQREIKRFTGRRAVVIDGTKALRARQYQWSEHFPYVVTNYESIVNDWEYVKDMHLEFIVLDEATAIKGLRSKRSRRIKFLAKNVPVKYALTGQPVENRPEELFSIMQFVDPEVLGEFFSMLLCMRPSIYEQVMEARIAIECQAVRCLLGHKCLHEREDAANDREQHNQHDDAQQG